MRKPNRISLDAVPQRLAMHTMGSGKWELSINGQPVMTIDNTNRAGYLPYSTILLPASARTALRAGENTISIRRTIKEHDSAQIEFALLAVEE